MILAEELKKLCLEYDKEKGCYPESKYEGQSLYMFLLEKIGLVERLSYSNYYLKIREEYETQLLKKEIK